MRRLRPILAVLLLVLAYAAVAHASTPAAGTLAASGGTDSWSGTIPPGANPTSDCALTSPLGDSHDTAISVPSGYYDTHDTTVTWKITWPDSANDEILSVFYEDGTEVGSSDGSSNSETVSVKDPKQGTYTAVACPFTGATPQAYTGTATAVSQTKAAEASVPAADAKGLSFSASVPADPQRDEAEPLMNIDDDGRIYTCGPTGFSNASDYAQVSTDGGDQFHLLGTPPRGQQAGGGGGDCGLASAHDRNSDGFLQYAYAGLGPLTGFTTNTSPDGGRTLFNVPLAGNTNTAQGGGADRQWLTFLDGDNVLLSYNQQQPRNIVVQKSTDGGYSYVPGNDTIAAGPNPDFPGPMRSMPASLLGGPAGKFRPYFAWTADDSKFAYVNLAIGDTTGLNWKDCNAAKIPIDQAGGRLQAFAVADNDRDGNIYIAFADQNEGGGLFHSYLVSIHHSDLSKCDGPTNALPQTNPGFSAPTQVDRGSVRTTVFPWLVARGAPGRVAVSFYGTESQGDPNTGAFKASWDVYVNQSLNALDAAPDFSQVKATTHPFHYDSICLNGLGCDLSTPPGDRSLADFFAIDVNPKTGKLSLVYNRTNKKPDDASGRVATPLVATQNGGPSNLGDGQDTSGRPALRTSSDDPAGDALVGYSNLNVTPPNAAQRTPAPANEPALDYRSADVSANPDGGFRVTLKLADLSDGAIQQAMTDMKSTSLLWVFTFVNGYTQSAASARYDGQSFSYGYNDYTTGSAQCGSDSDKCVQFPGDTPLKGAVDRAAGTIAFDVPRSVLRGLSGGTGDGQRPSEVPATVDTRFYDGTAFSLGNTAPDQSVQTFLYPADNTPAMDFTLQPAGGTPLAQGTPSAPTPGAAKQPAGAGCKGTGGFATATVAPEGRAARFSFVRRVPAPVTVDVFQQSRGRTVIGERLVARYTNKTRSFDWNGRANRRGRKVTDGYYFVRYRVAANGGTDVRRVTLRRVGGRFSRRPDFYRRASCALLTSYKLLRPVFGGPTKRPLGIAYRVSATARVSVVVTRGARTIRRFATTTARANRTYRLTQGTRGLATGDYKVTLRATRGGKTTTAVLTSRRL